MIERPVGPGLSLQDGLKVSGMSLDELWLRQVSVGGNASSLETEAYLVGVLVPDPHQHDLLAQALNEHFVELGQDHPVGYWNAMPGG